LSRSFASGTAPGPRRGAGRPAGRGHALQISVRPRGRPKAPGRPPRRPPGAAYAAYKAHKASGAPAPLEPTCSGVSSGTHLAAASSPGATSGRVFAREWMYRLVMFPSYFTPCHGCCMGNKTPKREQLLTLFDTGRPSRVYCSHCPDQKGRGPWLLQVRAAPWAAGSFARRMRSGSGARRAHACSRPPARARAIWISPRRPRPTPPRAPPGPRPTCHQVRRSAFKDVVKATDIVRFGCDTGGVQQYTLNGSKVLYLNREAAPERKGAPTAAAPATCAVDGRAMMDKNSQYCSLKCKMHGEDPEFNEWLDMQDPSVRAAAYAAATAPPRPTAACKRAAPNGYPYSYSGGASASAGASPASSGGSAGGAASGSGGAAGTGSSARSRKAPRTAASEASGPGAPAAAAAPRAAPAAPAVAAPPAAPLRVSLTAGRAAASAAQQSAFLAAATDGPVLGGDWMAAGPLAGLEGALSCTAAWAAPPHGGPAEWAGPDVGGAADWWLAAPGGPAPTAAAEPALDDADAGLLVEWPAGGAPLGSSTSELLRYGSGGMSPGSDAGINSVFCWDC
jgi:uncharacterized membrane protein YgcG